ncbi:MAG: DUF434 domain-containing protein [Sulfolobales archaeon]|nr:DUF434 domain-containing protein [Sulfolobales archaeon]MCX8208062.1 DUF434 domain-containing protein [Sulfolobales archaeon]MDW8011134.1 DUF434 domain-containing protein [Sulfolobales archaeon]
MRSFLRSEVVEAARDYKYLLNRGYPQKASLDFVSANYKLTRSERALLLRCVHRDVDSEAVKKKTVRDAHGLELVIDGYNVILTVVSAIEGLQIFLCDDGFIRDLRSSYVKNFETPKIVEAVKYVAKAIDELKVKDVLIVLDKNVSWSAEHADFIRSAYGIKVVAAAKADIAVIGSGKVISSSDFVILLKSEKAFDLAQFTVRNLVPSAEIVELRNFLIN